MSSTRQEHLCFSFSTGFLFVKKKKCCVNLVKSRGLSHGKPKALPYIPEPIVQVPLFIGGSRITKKRKSS